MAKSRKQSAARQLRKNGESVKEIAKKLEVSKGSVSLWCKDIELTEEQIEKLHARMVIGSYKGRLKGAQIQKANKERKIEDYAVSGLKEVGTLSRREFFLSGLALYWGEGGKKSPATRFYNSDPEIIRFIIFWFEKILGLSKNRFLMYVTINRIHRDRLAEVNKYWAAVSGVPVEQFRKPILIKAKSKKVYDNFDRHYGTLCVRISKGTDLYYRILGWLKALSKQI